MVAATSAIDSAASAKHVTDATISSTAFDTPLSAVSWSYKPAAGSPAAPRLRGRTLQQASAAFSSVQAEFFGMQRASSDQSTASSSTQHDSDVGSAHMHSLSACCDDFTPEKYPDHAQEPTSARYSIDAVHYSRHQGAHHRPAVRWQNDADIHESAQSRYSPQHLMLSPNKSCMKQKPGGYTLWFSDTHSKIYADVKPCFSGIKSIDGRQGSRVLHGRKRSRLCSLD